MYCPFSIPFVLTFMHVMGGGVPPLRGVSTAYPHSLSPFPFLFIFLRTLLRPSKTQPLCFQAIPHSLVKTPGVGGTHEQDCTRGSLSPRFCQSPCPRW